MAHGKWKKRRIEIMGWGAILVPRIARLPTASFLSSLSIFFVFLFASRKKEKGPASKFPDRDLFLQIGESLTMG
jgi:hypothetical protein